MNPLEQKFNDELQRTLKENTVPFIVPPYWLKEVLSALKFTGPIGLGITGEELALIRKNREENKPVSLWEFAVLNNNLENRSQNDLQLSDENYDQLMISVSKLAELWNDHTKNIRNEVLKKLSEEKAKVKKN